MGIPEWRGERLTIQIEHINGVPAIAEKPANAPPKLSQSNGDFPNS
jgi:hypothetical protein